MAIHITSLSGGDITVGSSGSVLDATKTRFTSANGTVEEYLIEGTLDRTWLINNGFFDNEEENWIKSIKDLDIGTSVTSIGKSAFYDCTGLTSVTIPDSVTSIGNYAFAWCERLTSVTFEGKNKATVQGMSSYPFGLDSYSEVVVTIHCSDGDLTISSES